MGLCTEFVSVEPLRLLSYSIDKASGYGGDSFHSPAHSLSSPEESPL